MGCGASKVSPTSEDGKPLHAKNGKATAGEQRSNGHSNGDINCSKSSGRTDSKANPKIAELNGNISVESQENSADLADGQASRSSSNGLPTSNGFSPVLSPQSRAIAFDIPFGQNSSTLLANRPPRRLQKIESAPVLTREALEQKQAAAELKRQKELDKKVQVMSKRRSELLLAREMDKAQQQKAELEEKLAASEKKREKAQAKIRDQQRRREEKAKRVRMRAKKMKDGDDVADLNVYPDETYNADEEDESWDIGSPTRSFTRSISQDDNNNETTFDGKKGATMSQMAKGEPTDEQKHNLSEVHDFFDL